MSVHLLIDAPHLHPLECLEAGVALQRKITKKKEKKKGEARQKSKQSRNLVFVRRFKGGTHPDVPTPSEEAADAGLHEHCSDGAESGSTRLQKRHAVVEAAIDVGQTPERGPPLLGITVISLR